MELTQAHKTAVKQIVDSGSLGKDPKHFLAHHNLNPILYGTDKPQRLYLQMLIFAQTIRENPESDRIAVAKEFDPGDPSKYDKAQQPAISNYFIDWSKQGGVTSAGLARKDVKVDSAQEKDRRGFAAAFAQSPFDLGALNVMTLKDDDFYDALVRGVRKDNPKFSPPHRATLVNTYSDQLKNFAVRRACKFLLWESVLQHGRSVAYALDDMDLHDVARRRPIKLEGDGNRTKIPVCTSELRELFRNWDAFNKRVVFFKDFKVASPPWMLPSAGKPETLRAWSEYAVKRARAIVERSPKTPYREVYNQVFEYNKAGEYDAAIGAFHWARPSLEGKKTASWGESLSIQDY